MFGSCYCIVRKEATAYSIWLAGGEIGETFAFQQPEVTVGRVANNDLVLYDPEVSRRHLLIYFDTNQWIVEDQGSSNGTFLNGAQLQYPSTLEDGDIVIGGYGFREGNSGGPISLLRINPSRINNKLK